MRSESPLSPLFAHLGYVVPQSQQPEPDHPRYRAEHERAAPVAPDGHRNEHGPDYQNSAHCRSAALVERRVDTGFAHLVQKAVSMDEQNKMPAEKKDENDRGKRGHYGPEADVVHQPAKGKNLGKREEKIADFVNHGIFLATWSGADVPAEKCSDSFFSTHFRIASYVSFIWKCGLKSVEVRMKEEVFVSNSSEASTTPRSIICFSPQQGCVAHLPVMRFIHGKKRLAPSGPFLFRLKLSLPRPLLRSIRLRAIENPI